MDLLRLSSIVTDQVKIDNVTGDISVILLNVMCKVLSIYYQTLCSETADCLVTAMSNVERLDIGWVVGDVKFDIDILTGPYGYDGQGKCRRITVSVDIDKRTKIEAWIAAIGWKLELWYNSIECYDFICNKPNSIN